MRALVLVALVASAGVARAEPKPWAANVSDAEQTRALEIYKQANAEFEEARYAQALGMYRDAIKHWDHPAIRFNMAVCLVNLDQPLEAFEDLELSLKYGAEPLTAVVYAQGLTYKKLLLAQLAKVDVTSTEPNAEVTFDGVKLFIAPGTVTKLVLPGSHQLVATKPGFLTTTMSLVLLGGKATVADVKLTRIQRTAIVHRWAPWKPWTVVGVGAVLAVTGGYLEWRSYENFGTYNTSFNTMCAAGCGGPTQPPIPSPLASLNRRASIENTTAITMFVVGGLALATGSLGVYLNQPRSTLERNITVTPAVTSGAASLVVAGSF